MVLKDSIQKMKTLLSEMQKDIEKSERGNKAASQRVRTASIKFGKLTKLYRQESIAAEKEGSKLFSIQESEPSTGQVKKATAKIPTKRAFRR